MESSYCVWRALKCGVVAKKGAVTLPPCNYVQECQIRGLIHATDAAWEGVLVSCALGGGCSQASLTYIEQQALACIQ